MRLRPVLMFGAAVAAIGVFSAHDAAGGNHIHPNQQFYSVRLTLGQYFYSGAGRRMVVDDITYSVDYSPCVPSEACDFFHEGDIPDQFMSGQVIVPPTPPLVGAGGTGGSTWSNTTQYQEFVSSKHQWSEVGLCNGDSETVGPTFDAFSLATYGQLAMRSYRVREGFTWIATSAGIGPPFGEPGPAKGLAGGGGDGVAVAHSMPMTLASVATSGSRHFQSPPQCGDRVYFVASAGTYGVLSATAFVRGRTFAHTTQPPEFPVPDNTITVGGP